MRSQLKYQSILTGLVIYGGLPLFFYTLGDFPRRTLLKESFSLLFLLSFAWMLGLFFLSRSNRKLIHEIKMPRIISIHKFIGYTAIAVFLIHPFLLVVPRFFESGVDPLDAFFEILTSFDNFGIILGIIAWCLILVLVITSLLRNHLPMRYTSWRLFHGIVVLIFIAAATWHVLLLGRHIDLAMSIYILLLALLSKLVLSHTYLLNPIKERLSK